MESREIHLVRRPVGAATPDDFALRTVQVRDPAEGEVTVRNSFVSVDPYMRGRMNDAKSYVPPYELGTPMQGGAVGRVVASRDTALPEGTLVTSGYGWREAFTAKSAALQAIPQTDGVGESAYLGVLGMPGMTAWVGVTLVAPVHEGDAFFVSAASGAVGSVAGQLARADGASVVVGSAGGPDKCAAVVADFGFDACLDRGQPVLRQLREAAPDGIDVHFDNVGGEQLDAALIHARTFARFALCGGISSGYDGTPAPVNALGVAVGKQITLRGFIVSSYDEHRRRFLDEVGGLLADGAITTRETVFEGLDSAVEAFLGLFGGGAQLGKVLVRVGSR